MKIDGWRYYDHAAIPTCAPNEIPNISVLKDGSVWKINNNILFARWTTDYDCGYDSGWWYVIKDNPYRTDVLKAKRRYEINKGIKNFDVKIINPREFIEDLYRVTVCAYSGWQEKNRPTVTKEQIEELAESKGNNLVFAAFSKADDTLQGFAVVKEYDNYASLSILRTNPENERYGINAAIIDGILNSFNEHFNNDFYICDGERAIFHETSFQDYLEKYFGFRKAYCKLHLKYRKGVGVAVSLLYPFKRFIKGKSAIGSKILAVLKMEEIVRQK